MISARKRKAPPIALLVPALLLLLAAFTPAAAAEPIPMDANGLPMWEVREWNDFPVRIELGSYDELETLLERVPIASFNKEQVRVFPLGEKSVRIVFEPRITDEESRALRAAGYDYEELPDIDRTVRAEAERLWAEQAAEGGDRLSRGDKGTYHTPEQIGTILHDVETAHPSIAQRFSIGTSVEGRDLWAINISDNVGTNEEEPEVRLSGNIHGDESISQEMLVFLVEHLTDNYGTDPDVTYLVDNYDIFILPCHNPDGTVANTRYNDNGIDLNRNFPSPDGDIGGDGTWTEEVETVHFKNWGFGRHFVISANSHGGALVVNYPWDYTYTLHPDNDALIQLSLEYSTYNLPMYNGDWPQGITNGAQWYITKGCLQDWSNNETDCIDVTLELSDVKEPSASLLEDFWDDNEESYEHYIRAARYGVNGIVTGSDTGLPLDATITVSGNAMPVHTDPENGDYYKLLDTGTYDVTFSASGYIDETHYGVSVTWGSATVLDVDLDPVAYGAVSGFVREVGTNDGLDAEIEIRTYPGDVYVTTAQSDDGSGGAYSTNLVYGEYTFHVSCPGHTSADRQVTVDAATETEDFLLGVVTQAILFEDDFEGGSSQWTGDWGLCTSTAHGGTASMADSPTGDYADKDTTICVIASSIDLSEAEQCTLSFWARWDIEENWDCAVLEISTDGGSGWTPLQTAYTVDASGQGTQKPAGIPVFEDTHTGWVENVVDLAAYDGETDVLFRFRLKSDTSIHQDGFYFDDFQVRGMQVATGVELAAPGATRLMGNSPNPFNPITTIRYTLASPARVDLDVFDLSGRLVRSLVRSRTEDSGSHSVVWDGRSDAGRPVSSGVYFYRLNAGDTQFVRKMALIR
ncbi:MAG: immune inhibitor A [Candidatus Eisenbacteria bacterium]|nr:immune inhibitor A [Candidatus Eisenbacteria bacterium]